MPGDAEETSDKELPDSLRVLAGFSATAATGGGVLADSRAGGVTPGGGGTVSAAAVTGTAAGAAGTGTAARTGLGCTDIGFKAEGGMPEGPAGTGTGMAMGGGSTGGIPTAGMAAAAAGTGRLAEGMFIPGYAAAAICCCRC